MDAHKGCTKMQVKSTHESVHVQNSMSCTIVHNIKMHGKLPKY